MPIMDTNVIDGPNVQADGSHRGTVEFIFSDGRKFTRNVRAPDTSAWANLVVDLPAEVEASVSKQDAEADIDDTQEITATKEATVKQRAVAYLRNAWQQEHAFAAYKLFDRFNTYRLAQGWTLAQVKDGLAEAGLTAEEWNEMRTAYQYLNGGGRPAVMQAHVEIQNNWASRE